MALAYAERSWASPQKDKFRRQLAILQSARTIIAASGDAGLTMRAVAAQAGLSLATPYNLFGSKQAILEAIYEEDRAIFMAAFARHPSVDPLSRIFDMIDLSIAHFRSAPAFYRSVMALLWRNPAAALWQSQSTFVSGLVHAAVAAGHLAPRTPAALVSASLIRAFRATGQEWLDDLLTLDQLRHELGSFLILLLDSLATDMSTGSLSRVAERYRSIPPAVLC